MSSFSVDTPEGSVSESVEQPPPSIEKEVNTDPVATSPTIPAKPTIPGKAATAAPATATTIPGKAATAAPATAAPATTAPSTSAAASVQHAHKAQGDNVEDEVSSSGTGNISTAIKPSTDELKTAATSAASIGTETSSIALPGPTATYDKLNFQRNDSPSGKVCADLCSFVNSFQGQTLDIYSFCLNISYSSYVVNTSFLFSISLFWSRRMALLVVWLLQVHLRRRPPT